LFLLGKKIRKKLLTIVLLLAVLVIPASAIWRPGDPNIMHFPQLPDINETGVDVVATPTCLADDFQSSKTELITDIILWGAWLDDKVGPLDLSIAFFSNLPAGTGGVPYNRPGELLWYRSIPAEEIEATGIATSDSPLYEASTSQVIGATSITIQYEIYVDPCEAFMQHEDTIYWLSIQRPNVDDGNIFGWKTSFNHFNGAGVFQYVPADDGQPEIRQLFYPITHQYVGQRMDMAFVIATSVPGPGEGNFDGDGDVDLVDFAILASSWLTEDGDAKWNPDCDINIPADGIVDIRDLAVFAENWLAGVQ